MLVAELKRIVQAFKYSKDGLVGAYNNEAAFRTEVFCFIILTTIGVFLPVSWTHKVVLIASMALVLALELVNSAIEALTDHLFKEIHPTAKYVKDVSSAAVLVALLCSLMVWVWVLLNLTF